MILYINACVRARSRTKRLADCLLACLRDEVREVRVWECDFPAMEEETLRRRDELAHLEAFNDPLLAPAAAFAAADTIVIAAPLWDLSFPACLKRYLEQINVVGVTFCYNERGQAEGLCKAKILIYVTTAGGTNEPTAYGYGYVKALAETFYGIRQIELIQAAGLDLVDADPEAILQASMEDVRRRFGQ